MENRDDQIEVAVRYVINVLHEIKQDIYEIKEDVDLISTNLCLIKPDTKGGQSND
jgi:hypothetical protein